MTAAVSQQLPESLARLLDGEDLADKVGTTIELLTCGEDGWPRVTLLGVGEVLATAPSRLRIAVWSASGTCANLRRAGRALLVLVHDGGHWKIRVRATPVVETASEGTMLTIFSADVAEVRDDRVGYATLRGGIDFALAEPDSALRRWADTIDRMRDA